MSRCTLPADPHPRGHGISLAGLALVLTALLLAGCSSAPVETTETEPPPAPEPVTGRFALQATFPLARGWAADAQPARVRNYNLEEVPSADGKAGAWEITYVSQMFNTSRIYTWSALETEGLQKGAFQGQISPWDSTHDIPFQISILMIDTPDAMKTAIEHATEYLKSDVQKPPVTFLLEYVPRFNGPVWRVMWGNSVGTSDYSLFVHPGTGDFLGN